VASAAPPAMAAPAPEAAGAKLVRSMSEIRNQQVVRQQWDLTCGAAAIATLLTYQLGRPVSERQVVVAMLHRTSPSLVRARLGFSLLDLKVYVATQGLAAAAFGEMTLDDLDDLAPAIVPIRWHGFRHFVVYRGRQGGRVLIADPAFGNRTLPEEVFTSVWAGGVGFVVFDPVQPRAPNRMGTPADLFMAPGTQTARAATSGARPPSLDSQIGSGP
jgi:uncharacterized protein